MAERNHEVTKRQPLLDTMVIATPWDKDGHFYYNQKINCMRASGWAEYDGKRYVFDPARHFGTKKTGQSPNEADLFLCKFIWKQFPSLSSCAP